MTDSRQLFESIPGLDPGSIRDLEDIPPTPIIISGKVLQSRSLGVVKVFGGGNKTYRHISGSGIRLDAENISSNEVICEPEGRFSTVEPYNRMDATYAGFAIHQANTFALSGGGRLLADARTDIGEIYVELNPSRDGKEIRRITSGVDEADLALRAIGAYMGLNENDSQLLAKVALDFEKIHSDASRPISE